jgi:hypothetical protein
MFEEKEGFEQIHDEDMLWRYQDLPRYLDLLIRKKLFFTRFDCFEDPFEGQYNVVAENAVDYVRRLQSNNIIFSVSTWHRNSAENYAMWNIYAKSYGLAVQTNYKRLKDSFRVSDKPVHIGKVIYYNESSHQIPTDDPLAPFLHKRCMYEYENEVRCCYILDEKEKNIIWEEQDTYNGVFIPVDLDILIERIFISPYAPKWFRDLIERTNEMFNIHKEIVHSTVFQSEYFMRQ